MLLFWPYSSEITVVLEGLWFILNSGLLYLHTSTGVSHLVQNKATIIYNDPINP